MSRRRFPTKALVERLLEFSGCCARCGCKTGGANGLHWDHRIPLAMNGADELHNLEPLCKRCHVTEKTPDDLSRIAKAKRLAARHAGIRKPPHPGFRRLPKPVRSYE